MSWEPLEEALFVDRAARDPEAPVTPFVALQRVVVRMLFDPAFVKEVHDDTGRALGGLGLDPVLVGQLLKNDRRLWNADRLRRSRSLKILMEELKVASTLALAERRQLAFLESFFGSRFFHEAVQKRKYMALAFTEFLQDAIARGELKSNHLKAALGLEAAMARSRRALRDARRGHDPALERLPAGKPGKRIVAGPGVMSHFAPSGVIGLVQHVEKYLFQISQVPAMALCEDVPRPEPLPEVDASSPQPFLLEPQTGGKVSLSEIEPGFAHVVAACQRPVDTKELAAALQSRGIDERKALEWAESLLEAGVLREVRVEPDGRVKAPPIE